MKGDVKTLIETALNWAFYGWLLFFTLTASWTIGWHMVGDAYALGPYLPWLELVFPLSGLGLWGAFFAQWALGELRNIHITRWFYLLLFTALLMVSVLFSVHPESSLGYLSLWLSATLVLSLQLEKLFSYKWFWYTYGALGALNLLLYFFNPVLIDPNLLLAVWFFPWLWLWRLKPASKQATLAAVALFSLALYLPIEASFLWLLWASFVLLWGQQYRNFRRRKLWVWGAGVLGLFALGIWQLDWQDWDSWLNYRLSADFYAATSIWHGVGLGQFEWAQFSAQSVFNNPEGIVSEVPFWTRWWYEHGLLMIPMVVSLWLITLGHGKNFQFRTVLFWSTLLFIPALWTSAAGILLAAFWFFNRSAWEPSSQ